MPLRSASLDPIRHEKVGVAGSSIVPVGAEGKFGPVGREHWEAVKRFVVGDLGQVLPGDIDHEDVEGKPASYVV